MRHHSNISKKNERKESKLKCLLSLLLLMMAVMRAGLRDEKKMVSVNGKIPRYLQCFWTPPTAKTLVFMQFSACCKKPFFHAKVTKPCTLHLKLLRHGFQILKRTVAWTIYQGLSLQARRQYKSTLHWSIFAFRTLLKRQKPTHYKSRSRTEPNIARKCMNRNCPWTEPAL